MEVALLQHQYDLIDVALHHIRRRRRKRRRREVWVRPWIGRRRQFGLYDQLLVELRQEDQKSFKNFMRMPPDMFDELLARVGPRITKQTTRYREPLEPGLKLALTLRHLASGSTYAAMKYGWRVAHNTQSLVVREVCKAIIDEYMPEVMTCPTHSRGMACHIGQFPPEVELPPYMWCTRWEAHCLQVSSKEWFPILQL